MSAHVVLAPRQVSAREARASRTESSAKDQAEVELSEA